MWKQLREAGKLDQAISELEQRVASDPRSAENAAALGQAYLQKCGTIKDVREQGILAMQADKLFRRPHIPLLEERNTRTGFFELEMLRSILAQLPASLQPMIEFAYITGWRIPSEVLPLEWRQVDFPAGEIRLDAETTKNRDGRVFPGELAHSRHPRQRIAQRRCDHWPVDAPRARQGLPGRGTR